jgi:TPP-dependent pyruvate/acetoin dehydrogenase alpha subunit
LAAIASSSVAQQVTLAAGYAMADYQEQAA